MSQLRRIAARLRDAGRGMGETPAPPPVQSPPVTEGDTRKPLAVLTFVWNEAAYLRRWVDYYGGQVGRENLFVYAHGGAPMVAEIAAGCRIYDLPRNRVDDRFARRKSDLAAGMIAFLLSEYQTVIVGDVDEMVVIDPALGQSLPDYVAAHRASGLSLKPFNFDLLDDPEAGPLDPSRPVLAQRRLTRTRYQFCKPVIVSDRVEFAAGFHYSDHRPVMAPGAFLVHLHFADRAINEEIDALRRDSYASNPHLTDAHQRSQGFWSRHMDRYSDRNRKSRKMPIVELDDVLPEYLAAMNRSITYHPKTKINNPGWTMTFGDQPEAVRIRIPDRFADVL